MVKIDRTAVERNKRYRDRVKAENETRGSHPAKDPRSYKKDIPIQAWMESRYLATLSEWLDGRKITRRLSEVAQEGVRILVDHLVKSGEVLMIDDPVTAQEMLEVKYGIVIRKGYGAKGDHNRDHNALLTEQRREIAGSIEYVEPEQDMRGRAVYEPRPVHGRRVYTPEQEVEKARLYEKYKEIERAEGEERERVRRASNIRKDNTPLFDPTRPVNEQVGRGKRGDEPIVNLERNAQKMKEADDRIKDM